MSPATMRIRVPLAALLGSTGAVGIFVGRHGRIRTDSRDSARSCRSATSSGSYQLGDRRTGTERSEEHTSELQSQSNLVCRLLLEKKKKKPKHHNTINTKRTVASK